MAKKKDESWEKIGQTIGRKVEKEFKNKDNKDFCRPRVYHHGVGGGVYFLGFIGAAIYYVQTATGFWMGVWGVIKALVWPAFLVYKLLRG